MFRRLLDKLEIERESLGGAVFDVLGQAIEGRQLRELLKEALRYGNQSHVRARLFEKVDHAFDHERLKELIEKRALANDALSETRVLEIRDQMERKCKTPSAPLYIHLFYRSI
ncbi:MAG: hypothetical protein R3C03_22045 [Pirellulaceae bacterium]